MAEIPTDERDLDPQMAEALRPRRGFLAVGSIFAFLALLAYVFENQITSQALGTELNFVILLMGLSICAFFCVLCYRNPRIGNRFLGYDVVLGEQQGAGEGYHYSGGFKSESGLAEKRRASARKTARQSRRHYAKITRDMQASEVEDTE